MAREPELRVVLVGQERVGKSSAGNTILGKKEFDCKFSARPVTLSSERREGLVLGRRVSVVDTPGLFSTELREEMVRAELEKAVQLSSPGPCVFLLTLQLGRLTEQEQKGLKTLMTMLSPAVADHIMLLFTYGDRLEDTNIEQFIRGDKNLQKMLKKCSGQYHVFNNREMGNTDQVKELFDKIDSTFKGKYFTLQPASFQKKLVRWISMPVGYIWNFRSRSFRWISFLVVVCSVFYTVRWIMRWGERDDEIESML
ncbi:GTPase IMAP family member 4-like isoform X3 [Thunnus thynnus]|uniref:GTPase IMAP family member 4-like isoform X3 n=1 Tax=Thunnus thynnus TaxID=8237 RepID=UPI003529C80B